MSILRTTIKNGSLKEHYQRGSLRLISLPVDYGSKLAKDDNRFFAYLSTLGGGLFDGDDYLQKFNVINSDATLSSQSNQKIYKGSSRLKTVILLDEKSRLVFYNHANIFYEESNLDSKVAIFYKKGASLFYLDGGFIGYANAKCRARMSLRIYENYRLKLNDLFWYKERLNLNGFFDYDYFYAIIIICNEFEIPEVNERNLKAFSSRIDNLTMIRVASNNNDIAMSYIDEIKMKFIKESR